MSCKQKSADTGSEFATQEWQLLAKRLAECGRFDEEALLWPSELAEIKRRTEQALKEKRITYDRSQAEKCILALERAPCNELFDAVDIESGPCMLALVGQVRPGGECFELSTFNECDEGTYCLPATSCSGTCTSVVAAGGACGAGTLCAPHSTCLEGICRKHAEIGATCGGNTEVRCRAPSVCLYGDDTKTGTCSEALSEGPCRLDEATGTDFGDCALGYQCQYNADGTTTCAAARAAGEPCEPGRNQCASFVACVKDDNGVFACTPYGGGGESCGFYLSAEGQKLPELRNCVESWCPFQLNESGDLVGTCQALVGEGGACNDGLECATGLGCDLSTKTCVVRCPLQ